MAVNSAIIVLLFMGLVTLVVVLPATLTTSTPVAAPSDPPMGNELEVPPGAAALVGDNDLYTQRVCPLVGAELPARATDERTISNDIFAQSAPMPDPRGLNAFVWVWGQIIDHDIILSLTNETLVGDTIEMFPEVGAFLSLSRVQTRLLGNGRTETLNQISGAIDGSTVYGDYKNPEKLANLRADGGASCMMTMGPGQTPKYDGVNFFCGDVRCEEHSLLTSMHSLLLREHNRWCTRLGITGAATAGWTEEQKFWKARSLTVAVIQRITYEEWLPALFGSQQGLLYSVAPKGEYTRITTEFGVVAYRYGHSMVASTLGELNLHDLFFSPAQTIALGVDTILDRALTQYAETADNNIVDGLRNFLFIMPNMTVGEDLLTRNLYRAREVRMISYVDICACYGTSPIEVPFGITDPMVGLLSEPLVSGSSLPRTIARVLAEQFRRLRDNDEHYYTHNQLSPTEMYLVNQRSSLRDLLLRNTALTPEDVQLHAFFK